MKKKGTSRCLHQDIHNPIFVSFKTTIAMLGRNFEVIVNKAAIASVAL